MCLFNRRKKEQLIISKINKIIEGSGYTLALYKKDYKHFGNCIIKLVCPCKANIEIITDRSEIIFDNKIYPMEWLGDTKKIEKDTLVIKFLELIFNILQSDDWRLAGKECYLFDELVEVNPTDYINSFENPEMFHEHCIFCWDKVEESKDDKYYRVLDNSYWICENCYNDLKDILQFKVK